MLNEREKVIGILHHNPFTDDLQLALMTLIQRGYSLDIIKEALDDVVDECLAYAKNENKRRDTFMSNMKEHSYKAGDDLESE